MRNDGPPTRHGTRVVPSGQQPRTWLGWGARALKQGVRVRQFPLICDFFDSGLPPYARCTLVNFRQNTFCDAARVPNVVAVWPVVHVTLASLSRLVGSCLALFVAASLTFFGSSPVFFLVTGRFFSDLWSAPSGALCDRDTLHSNFPRHLAVTF